MVAVVLLFLRFFAHAAAEVARNPGAMEASGGAYSTAEGPLANRTSDTRLVWIFCPTQLTSFSEG